MFNWTSGVRINTEVTPTGRCPTPNQFLGEIAAWTSGVSSARRRAKTWLPHCLNYQIGSMTAIEIHPGETAQRLHTDEDALYPVRVSGIPFVVSAMWALSDFTEDNGATCETCVLKQNPRNLSVPRA